MKKTYIFSLFLSLASMCFSHRTLASSILLLSSTHITCFSQKLLSNALRVQLG